VTRVLVTGSNGLIGHHLCRRLVDRGAEVIALVHRRGDRLPNSPALLRFAGDVLDSASLARALGEHGPVGAIAHLATEPPGDGARAGTNETGTANILHAAREAGVRRVVFTSTMSVFDFLDPQLRLPLSEQHPVHPVDRYGLEKHLAEQLCRRAVDDGDLGVPILRLAGVYGPGKRRGAVYNFLYAALQGESITIAADRGVDLVWVEDVVGAVEDALTEGEVIGTFHIGSGQAVSLSEVARTAIEVAGASAAARVIVGGSGNSFCLDIGRARRQFGFVPTPLRTALERFLPAVAHDLEADRCR
jgi:UDP-glucose 4-epimerase